MAGDEQSRDVKETDALLQSSTDEENPVDAEQADAEKDGGKHKRYKSAHSFFEQDGRKRRGEGRPSLLTARGYTSVSHRLVGSISHGLGVIKEDAQTSVRDIRHAFTEKINEADSGDTYFLESSITRAVGVVPERLPDLLEEAVGIAIEEEVVPPPKKVALAGEFAPYISLMCAVFAVSSNGTVLALWKGVPAPLKLYWRMVGTASFLALFAGRTVYRDGMPKLSFGQWVTFFLAAGCFALHTLLFVIALNYTSIGNTVIYANSQAVLLLLGKVLVRTPIVFLEGGGALMAFAGAILCSIDSEGGGKEDAGESLAVFGDALALLAAAAGVGYLTFARAVKPHVGVTVFIFMVMFVGSFLVLLFMLATGVPISLSMDEYHGLFGWMAMRPDRLLAEIWIVLVCNVVGTMGFVRAMAHLDNMVIAVATLMEPMIASFIAAEMKVGSLPGLLGWFGNALVAVGTLGVVYPSVKSGQSGGH